MRVHLRERPHVEAVARPVGDDLVELEEELVVFASRKTARRRRLALAVRAGVQRKERNRSHAGRDPAERVALGEADEYVLNLAALTRLRFETSRVSVHAEQDSGVGGGC